MSTYYCSIFQELVALFVIKSFFGFLLHSYTTLCYMVYVTSWPIYTTPDSYHHATAFILDSGAVYIIPEPSDTRHSTNGGKDHCALHVIWN